LLEDYKLVRRCTLIWACWLITDVVIRVTQPDIITNLTGPGATVVTAVIGILATVIAFYQHNRSKTDQ
jgi:hypothetical protein